MVGKEKREGRRMQQIKWRGCDKEEREDGLRLSIIHNCLPLSWLRYARRCCRCPHCHICSLSSACGHSYPSSHEKVLLHLQYKAPHSCLQLKPTNPYQLLAPINPLLHSSPCCLHPLIQPIHFVCNLLVVDFDLNYPQFLHNIVLKLRIIIFIST